MKTACLALLWLGTLSLLAQSSIPPGTILPVQLDTGLNARKLHANQTVRARIMQNIPGTPIHRGAHVLGHVVSATPDRVEIHFDAVTARGRQIPITASLRALASMMEVDQAQIPEGGADRALTPDQRNRRQIGGEEVYRYDGPVTRGLYVVGRPTPYGVLGRVNSDGACRDGLAGNDQPQALWLFSTDACGIYGYDGLALGHAGRTAPMGTIRIGARSGKLNIRSGSGLLLRVLGS